MNILNVGYLYHKSEIFNIENNLDMNTLKNDFIINHI
jgi:hypothetical protein